MDVSQLPANDEVLAFLRDRHGVENDEVLFVIVFDKHHISEAREQYRAFASGLTVYLPPCIQCEFMEQSGS
ncbi:MAG: hypothetical protein WAZ27_04915 [Minisyncoccia bacterium]